ncbi:hypothetical protein ATK36_4900 [Amycolatopsis sulphurea]|uniref:Uncharacterized protein n=1 Tax=Amycolatopsis sulphurea TaxID=76022 RepID=A0A2A9FG25_9PSEU|nr:hypothetical protein ATK36_4900 [Amycolatopsis sulphurea]
MYPLAEGEQLLWSGRPPGVSAKSVWGPCVAAEGCEGTLHGL